MKTSMKKKALVSSVAMLSVASLALGTATYAWFTNNTHAEAQGINMATSQNSSLELSKLDHQWGTKINYYVEGTGVIPASSADGENWYTANAVLGNHYLAVDGSARKVETMNASSGTETNKTDVSYVLKDQINIRNAGSAVMDKVKLTMTADFTKSSTTYTNDEGETVTLDAVDYVRIAVVPSNINATESDGDFAKYVYASDNKAYSPVASVDTESSIVTGTAITPNVLTPKKEGDKTVYTLDILNGTTGLAADEAKYYNLYVWFEGQDEDCMDVTAGLTLPSITFTADVVGEKAAE